MADRPTPRRVLEMADTLLRALDRAGIGVSIATEEPDGRAERIFTNRAAAEIFGVSLDELDHIEPMSTIAPEDRPRLAAMRERVRADASVPQRMRAHVIRADGERVPVEFSLTAELFDDRPTVFAFVRDVSAQERMAEAARASEASFRALAEAAPDSIALLRHGALLYINPAGARVLGHGDPSALIGARLASFLLPEDARIMAERVQRVLAGEHLLPFEYRVQRRDGAQVSVEISSLVIDYHGEPAVLAVGRETTERRQLQAELMQADRMATVGTLAAGVAHEINNPLTYVLLHLERLWRLLPQLVPDEQRREGARTMIAEALEGSERMRSIVRDLLAFSRPDNREQRRVDVRQVLDSTVKLAATGLKRRASVVTRYDPAPLITSNPSKLGQVFLNLVVNALQAVDEAGKDGLVEVSLHAHDEQLVIEIADNGPGIAPQQRSRIFDPFFTTKPIGTGTGLGLPISRSICEALGGSLTVDNRPGGGGALARITLPTSSPEPSDAPELRHVSRRPPDGIKRSVLIVDDEPCVARALAALLRDAYRATLCNSGQEAMELLLGEATFDAIFCDLTMPELSGIVLYQTLLARRPEVAARFALVTGGPTTGPLAAALRQCEAPILVKPFDIDEVLELAALLSRGRSTDVPPE